ncbi:ClpP crotonase [Suillus lakei]|nr:ClpP crotonase [Suillus lakei]
MSFVAPSRSTLRHVSNSTRFFSTGLLAQCEYANVLVLRPSLGVGAMILTGSERAFAAGADIKEMKDKSFAEAYTTNFLANWEVIPKLIKPVIAAVSGYALGGGLELAFLSICRLILFSQHLQHNLASQKSTSESSLAAAGPNVSHVSLGKSRATELILTRRIIDADEADRWGIVRVVREGSVVEEAVKVASDIASKGRIAVGAGKEAANAAFEMKG